jgi:hypothetical protein
MPLPATGTGTVLFEIVGHLLLDQEVLHSLQKHLSFGQGQAQRFHGQFLPLNC